MWTEEFVWWQHGTVLACVMKWRHWRCSEAPKNIHRRFDLKIFGKCWKTVKLQINVVNIRSIDRWCSMLVSMCEVCTSFLLYAIRLGYFGDTCLLSCPAGSNGLLCSGNGNCNQTCICFAGIFLVFMALKKQDTIVMHNIRLVPKHRLTLTCTRCRQYTW